MSGISIWEEFVLRKTLLVLLTLVLLLAAGCTKIPAAATGRVVRSDGTGIPDVQIQCWYKDGYFEVNTDANGFWSVSGVVGVVNVKAVKEYWTFTPEQATLDVSDGTARMLTFSGKCSLTGRLVVSTSRSDLILMNVDGTGQQVFWQKGSSPDLSPDGTKVICLDGPSGVSAFSVPDGSSIWAAPDGLYPCWSPDGKRAAFMLPDMLDIYSICVWNADGTSQTTILTLSPGDVVRGLVWSTRGIVYAVNDKVLVISEDSSGWKPPVELTPLAGCNPDGLAVSPDGSCLALYQSDGTLIVYRFGDGKAVTFEIRDGIRSLSWSPDGSLFTVATGAGLDIMDLKLDHYFAGDNTVTTTTEKFLDSKVLDLNSVRWHQ